MKWNFGQNIEFVHSLFYFIFYLECYMALQMWPAPTKPETSRMGLFWDIGHDNSERNK